MLRRDFRKACDDDGRGWHPTVDRLPGPEIRVTTWTRGVLTLIGLVIGGLILLVSGEDSERRPWSQVGLMRHDSPVWSLAFSPDGKSLASADLEGTVKLWDVATRQVRLSEQIANDPTRTLSFSQDGRTLAGGGWSPVVRLWDVDSNGGHRSFDLHQEWSTSVAFSPDGRHLAVSSSRDRNLCLWEWPDPRKPVCRIAGDIRAYTFTADGRKIATGEGDGTIRIREVASGRVLREFQTHLSPLLSLVFSPDGRFLATSSAHHAAIHLWDTATSRPRAELNGHERPIAPPAFSPDGSLLATADRTGVIRLWDPASGREVAAMAAECGWLRALTFSPDNRMLATAGQDGSIRLWDLAEFFRTAGA